MATFKTSANDVTPKRRLSVVVLYDYAGAVRPRTFVVLLFARLGASPALAAEPPPGVTHPAAPPDRTDAEMASVIGGTSTCPSPEAVWAELGTLVPRDRLHGRLRALAGEAARIEIEDHGVPYLVIAGGRVREYRDETRDCAYRARIAAVFVALAIDPAEIRAAQATQAAPPPPPVVALAPQPEPAPPRPLLRVDVGAALDAGVGPAAEVAHGGVSLRMALGRGRIAGVMGLIALVPVDTDVGGVQLHQQRWPADLGVRIHLGASRLEPYAELGVAVALISVRGRDLVSPQARTSVEVGARGALGIRLPLRARLSLFGALHAEIVPTPPEIFALPRGAAGNTPFVWMGATLGASLGLL